MAKISNRTKQYIQDYTKQCSNELVSMYDIVTNQFNNYEGWLTVENAESACLIEREEVLREVTTWMKTNLSQFDITDTNGYTIGINDIVHFFNRDFKTK